MRILGLLIGLAVLCSNASATIIVTIGSATLNANSDVQTINVFARSTAAESTTFLTADFTLGGAQFATVPGTFGGDGFIGNGNLQPAPASSFLRDANTRLASLSLDFVANQLFPSTDTLLATLRIDTNGALNGVYSITASVAVDGAIAPQVNPGSITVVPEPTSMALIGLGIGGLVVRRAVRFRKKVSVA